jgi:hypothetical protein
MHALAAAGTAPAAPTNLDVTEIGSTAANFQWTDNSDNETVFQFQRKRGAAPNTSYVNCGTSAANTTVCQLTGFTPSFIFIVRMRAENAYGVSDWNTMTHTFQMLAAGEVDPWVPFNP